MRHFSLSRRNCANGFSYLALIFISEIGFHVSAETDALSSSNSDGGYFIRFDEKGALKKHTIDKSDVFSFMKCGLKCVSMQPECKSFNYIESPGKLPSCEINDKIKSCAPQQDFIKQPDSEYFESDTAGLDETCSVCENSGKYVATAKLPGFKCICKESFGGERCQDPLHKVCLTIKEEQPLNISTLLSGIPVKVFCDARETEGGWTLIARFSNKDNGNWMEDNGTWWYDRVEAYGNTLDPSDNADMISEAFWLQQGSEFKITKSDDPTHTALLTTTGNCLNGMTFRAKVKSYGVFRSTAHWATDQCLGSCSVTYGGSYTTVKGFGQSQCDGLIQTRKYIGFWCDHGVGDGAVLMIGGGGPECSRADHGIGLTEENMPAFEGTTSEADFGDNAQSAPELAYALNLWVR